MSLLAKIFTAEVIAGIVFGFLSLYLWFQYKYTYWSRRGVSGPKPTFPFGNITDVIKRKSQFFQPYIDNYDKYKHLPYVGMYSFYRPVLSIHDPDIAKLILIKDFDHFQAHGIFSGGEGDPLAGHLFNMHGEQWKMLRSKMSPTFTSGKVKMMYPLVEHIANEALNYVDLLYSNGETVNFTDLYAKYSMEIIGSVGFGVECNGFKNPNSEFYIRGHEYFDPQSSYWTFVRALAFFMPDFFKILKIRRISPRIINFFFSLVKESVEYRQKHSYIRNDFLQTLVELNNEQKMNDKAIYDGECTYEAQNEMVYLNMVIDETMRLHPPMRALFRKCTKSYKMPNSDLVIEKGTLLFVPNQAIQMNPEIFPQPEKFNPGRFAPENKSKMHPCHWMPFGEGPRKCLGLRQGYIQSKMALVKILNKYELLLDKRTPVPMKLKASSLAYAANGGVWLKLRQIYND
ncbi:probable cytochrome P450 6a14 [Leguminivora glycinivorella]|uniref:probable cytochrome P450 6a14 n=1 Tax=Leguminivora glycinivorella TaxID=1035111 RepID=UPI00200D980D|nr:probable cytochrome P450 6a14 [Leguminivora glycinivorella]